MIDFRLTDVAWRKQWGVAPRFGELLVKSDL
jgi:hypothetical protein